ncbi:MAG TPA: hypothetical protein VII99_10680 [Bacteroidia bacterium]
MDDERSVPDLQVRTTDGMNIILRGVEEINVSEGILTFSDDQDDEIAMIPIERIFWIIKKGELAKVEEI